jgi:hypothetical protein
VFSFTPRPTYSEEIIAGGHAVAQLVAALRYNPEDHGFDSQWGHWDFA